MFGNLLEGMMDQIFRINVTDLKPDKKYDFGDIIVYVYELLEEVVVTIGRKGEDGGHGGTIRTPR